jgi:hypothetical protein
LTKNLKNFCPKSPKIVTSKGLTNQYTCIRDQIKRMPINELSILQKKCVNIKLSFAQGIKKCIFSPFFGTPTKRQVS